MSKFIPAKKVDAEIQMQRMRFFARAQKMKQLMDELEKTIPPEPTPSKENT